MHTAQTPNPNKQRYRTIPHEGQVNCLEVLAVISSGGLRVARLCRDCRGSHRPSPARTSPIHLGGLLAAGWAGDIWCERVGQEGARPPSVPPLSLHSYPVTFGLEQMAEVGVVHILPHRLPHP